MWWLRARRYLKATGRQALMLAWACRQPATPMLVKLGALALLLYAISPIDLIPDVPIIGWIDDAAILMLGIPFLLKRVPARVRDESVERVERALSRFGLGGRAR
jgi:uncharacterized membrane protein YkvA (DUF1232 family)